VADIIDPRAAASTTTAGLRSVRASSRIACDSIATASSAIATTAHASRSPSGTGSTAATRASKGHEFFLEPLPACLRDESDVGGLDRSSCPAAAAAVISHGARCSGSRRIGSPATARGKEGTRALATARCGGR
jgi:hypothetical protein